MRRSARGIVYSEDCRMRGIFLAHWRAIASVKTGHGRGMPLAGFSRATLVAAVPLVLSGAQQASAGSLLATHERTSVRDALHTGSLLGVHASDPSSDDARFAVDGHQD